MSLTAVGAYIFAGGFSVGIEKSLQVLAHLETGPYGVRTYKLNRPHVPVYVGEQSWPLARFKSVNLVFCNPPCALFSAAGKSIYHGRENWRTDPRQACIRRCFQLLADLKPDMLAIESVPLAFTRGRELWDELAVSAHAQGYGVTHLLEDARWHAVAQRRPRYMFLVHRYALDHELVNWAPPPTVAEVLTGVSQPGYHSPLSPSHAKLAHALRPGEGLRAAWEHENPPASYAHGPSGVVGRPRFCEHRLRADAPMGAYVGDFFIHPTEPRRLGLEEARELCGFPAGWRFSRDQAGASELARGVMPALGAWLGRTVVKTVQNRLPLTKKVQVLDLREPPAMI